MRRSLVSTRCPDRVALAVAGCGSDEQKPTEVVELEETLGFSSDGILERQSRVENRIRDCMKAQGFEYTPVDPFAQQQALTGKARLSEEEFIEQFGYGISTLVRPRHRAGGSQRADPPEPVGHRPRRVRSGALGRQPRRDVRGRGRLGPLRRARRLHEGGERGDLRRRPGADRARHASSTSWTGTSSRTSGWCAPRRSGRRAWRERGFRYADPGDIEGDIEERFTDDRRRRREAGSDGAARSRHEL